MYLAGLIAGFAAQIIVACAALLVRRSNRQQLVRTAATATRPERSAA